jgi:hypothetical protein
MWELCGTIAPHAFPHNDGSILLQGCCYFGGVPGFLAELICCVCGSSVGVFRNCVGAFL